MLSSDSRIRREHRRLELALRMMGHLARRSTVVEWTQINSSKLRRVRDVAEVPVTVASYTGRGPRPNDIDSFVRTSGQRSEAATAAFLCMAHGVLPAERGPAALKRLPGLERGERLCDAFEAYRWLVPHAHLSFDRFLLLVEGLVAQDSIALGRCGGCGGSIVVDAQAPGTMLCGHCRDVRAPAPTAQGEADSTAAAAAPAWREPVQASLF